MPTLFENVVIPDTFDDDINVDAEFRLRKRPPRDVMSVYTAAPEWHRLLGPLDAVVASVVEGRMSMPKPRLPLRLVDQTTLAGSATRPPR